MRCKERKSGEPGAQGRQRGLGNRISEQGALGLKRSDAGLQLFPFRAHVARGY